MAGREGRWRAEAESLATARSHGIIVITVGGLRSRIADLQFADILLAALRSVLEVSEVADTLLALHPNPAISPKVDLINGIFVCPWTVRASRKELGGTKTGVEQVAAYEHPDTVRTRNDLVRLLRTM